MGTADWPILTDPLTPRLPVRVPADPGLGQLGSLSIYGRCVARPLRRDQKADYAIEEGARLVRAAVGQILGTRSDSALAGGELPWRTDFGSHLYLLRNRLNSAVLVEQARRFVADAIRRWEPRIQIKRVRVTRNDAPPGIQNVLTIRVKYDLVDRNSNPNAVLVPDLSTEVQMAV